MSAEGRNASVLREAAAAMRGRAELATEGPWEDFMFPDGSTFVERISVDDDDLGHEVGCINRPSDAEHIASWNPIVALAVADLLDFAADNAERLVPERYREATKALAVALAYLEKA